MCHLPLVMTIIYVLWEQVDQGGTGDINYTLGIIDYYKTSKHSNSNVYISNLINYKGNDIPKYVHPTVIIDITRKITKFVNFDT